MTAGPTTDTLSTETAGLPAGVDPELVELSDGDVFEFRIAPVTKRRCRPPLTLLGRAQSEVRSRDDRRDLLTT
jgi:hypothetical protein